MVLRDTIEKRHHLRPLLLQRARGMRQESAPAEQRLWSALRSRQLGGFKFRRQQTIGNFIADFYCAECRLIVELDGDSHSERQVYDEKRSKWLEMEDYAIVRYVNTDVFENLTNLLSDLLKLCESRNPHRIERGGGGAAPTPPRQGEREPEAP
jgi:very-short-patch-repair endonuclease